MDTVFYPQGAEEPHPFHMFIAEFVGARLSRSKFDLLKAKNILAGGLLPPPTLAKFVGGKRLVSIIGDTWLYHYVTNQLNWRGKLFTKFALNQSDLSIAEGDLNANFLDEMGFSNYINVYPFINEWKRRRLEKLSPPLESNIILTIARRGEKPNVYRKKGLDILKSIARNMPDFEFVVVGTSLKSDVRNLKHTGWISLQDLESYIENSLILLAPARFDTFPAAILECMTAGLPSIMTLNVGPSRFSPSELIASNEEEMKEKIIKFSELSADERLKYGKISRKIASRFTEERFTESFISDWKKYGPWEIS